MAGDIRLKVDGELTKRVGTWFTIREIQDTLRINPATLKPLLMKYARENLLKRRHVKGTARSVQFTPAAGSKTSFGALITKTMPYRKFLNPNGSKKSFAYTGTLHKKTAAKKTAAKKTIAKKTIVKKTAGIKAAAKKSTGAKGLAPTNVTAAARTATRRYGAKRSRA